MSARRYPRLEKVPVFVQRANLPRTQRRIGECAPGLGRGEVLALFAIAEDDVLLFKEENVKNTVREPRYLIVLY
jgi:hypothetical protein